VTETHFKGWDGMKKPPGVETGLNIVLSVSSHHEDGACLERILKSGWTVIASSVVDTALSVLQLIPIPIVIYDCDGPLGAWTEMLDQISLLPDPPLFIVTSRLADERLWAEALNLGAWDVLAKPFDADEVMRIAGIACQHWKDRHGSHFNRTKQTTSANGSKHLAATGT